MTVSSGAGGSPAFLEGFLSGTVALRTLMEVADAWAFSSCIRSAHNDLDPNPRSGGGRGKPDAPNGSFVEVENGKIYYEECGNAPTSHSVVWDGVWPLFCQNFRTIRYDRRGYGKSPAATTWYYETDDLAALLRHLKVPRAVLVGSSHGSELSIDFALCHPDMVEQLVLVGAVVSGFPYSDHFLNRGMENSKPFQQNDVKNGIANWAKDRYLLAPGHETAQKKLLDILTASPQDLTGIGQNHATGTVDPRFDHAQRARGHRECRHRL